MRNTSVVATGMLLGAALFSSCTCQKQVSQPPTTFQQPPSGFHVAEPKTTPDKRVAAATPTQAPQQVAEAGTPTARPEIPPDFPREVPIFEGAAVSQVQDLANDAHNVIFTTPAPVGAVQDFYRSQMTKAGWRVTQQFDRTNHAFLSFKKGDMIANVTIAEDVHNPGQQVIAIMYEQQKPLDFDEF